MGEDNGLDLAGLCLEALRDKSGMDEVVRDEEDLCFEEKCVEDRLDEMIRRGSHFPSPEVSDLLKMKCQVHIGREDYDSAAVALLHSQGLLFRHQVLVQYNKRLRRREEERRTKRRQNRQTAASDDDMFASTSSSTSSDDEDGRDEDEKAERLVKRSMAFQDLSTSSASNARQHLRSLASRLPDDWRIVQVTSKPTLAGRFCYSEISEPGPAPAEANCWKPRNPGLYLTVVQCGSNFKTLVAEIPSLENADRPTVMREYSDIVSEHRLIYQKTESYKKAAYDRARDDLDDRMKSLLDSIENRYLGHTRILLLGATRDAERRKKLAKATGKLLGKLQIRSSSKDYGQKSSLVEYLLDGSSLLTPEEILEGCAQLSSKKTVLKELVREIEDFGSNNPTKQEGEYENERGPLAFILDSEIQPLPWESLSVTTNQPCSRVPSIFFLSALYETHEKSQSSVTRIGVQNNKIFYVLNPNKDLQKTQSRLEEPFKTLSLGEGVVGQWPSFPKIQDALSNMDAFMYCGHGSRLKTMSAQEIEKLQVRAVPLLFGCNSGRLERIGRSFDPIGGAHSYLIATSPALLGFLWSVTDLDVDRWTVQFLEHWLGSQAKGTRSSERDFVRAVAQRRRSFSRLLNGAALVVYGLPAFMLDKVD